MVLDDTLREELLYNSIKKFFIDNIKTDEGIHVAFDRTVSPPEDETINQWVNVRIEDNVPNHVTMATVSIYMFAREDLEGNDLSRLRDKVMDKLYSGFMDLYDDSWNKFASAIISVVGLDEAGYLEDGTKMKSLLIELRWGAKW